MNAGIGSGDVRHGPGPGLTGEPVGDFGWATRLESRLTSPTPLGSKELITMRRLKRAYEHAARYPWLPVPPDPPPPE